MRTLITLLLLACFAWTLAMAADCPMAEAPSGEPAHAAASASTHHGHHAPAVPSLASSLPALDAHRPDGLSAGRDSYASPSLSTDPPPPRIALRS